MTMTVEHNNDYLETQLQKYIHASRYARFLPDKKRRETWVETVDRYHTFFQEKFPKVYPPGIRHAIYNLDILPSMRCLMTAGKALDRDNVAGYNCSYLPIDSVRAFDETLYILMCGTGVGFSVERQYINKLPEIPENMYPTDTKIIVHDSKIGWATALRELVALLYAGKLPSWDLSALRPAGAPLKTFGGRSSGPQPLDDLFTFTTQKFMEARGRRLNSLEVHDIICKVGDVVVVGGVRRSALLSLSNLTDERMRGAKMGQWWEQQGQRALANNSVCYTEKPDMGIFLKEWSALYESRSGERGIFNRTGARNSAKAGGRREFDHEFGTNPCGEIVLRPNQFCNLTEVVVRSNDTAESLVKKVRLASILGTFQSTLTEFRYLRKVWRTNCEEERLLGVSLTGIMDHPLLGRYQAGDGLLASLKQAAIDTNIKYAEILGINKSAAVTTVKPSGTVSQLVNSSSGIHPRYSKYYVRKVRQGKTDPLSVFMQGKGFPMEDDISKPEYTSVFSFPVKSPEGCVTREDRSAIGQLEHYLCVKRSWCEHNPSITIYVREDEWMGVGAWVYAHFDDIGGVSFLPYDTGIYKQAPFTEISKEEYEELDARMPKGVDFSKMEENQDVTIASQELACVGGVCDI